MKNRLIHGYFVVDYDIVWNIITKELPDLKTKIIRNFKRGGAKMKPFTQIAIPHEDILEGKLTMDVFAADLWQVANGKAP